MAASIRTWGSGKFYKEASRYLSDSDLDGDGVLAGAILLAALDVGTDANKIARRLDADVKRVDGMCEHLRKSKVFDGGSIRHSGWFDPETGGIGFCMDAAIALGWIERAVAA